MLVVLVVLVLVELEELELELDVLLLVDDDVDVLVLVVDDVVVAIPTVHVLTPLITINVAPEPPAVHGVDWLQSLQHLISPLERPEATRLASVSHDARTLHAIPLKHACEAMRFNVKLAGVHQSQELQIGICNPARVSVVNVGTIDGSQNCARAVPTRANTASHFNMRNRILASGYMVIGVQTVNGRLPPQPP